MFKITEIFESIQGEGFHAGLPVIFVRFAGCNMDCEFCDTDFSCKTKLSLSELLGILSEYENRNIVLTGGEPMLQVNGKLVSSLRAMGFTIHIETNGSFYIPFEVKRFLSWITVSPKSPEIQQVTGNELKIVHPCYSSSQLRAFRKMEFEHFYLQPKWNDGVKKSLPKVLKKIKEKYEWKLSCQVHKFIGVE